MLEIILTGCGLGEACCPALLPSLCSQIPPPLATPVQRASSLPFGSSVTQRGHLGKEHREELSSFLLEEAGDTFPVLLRFSDTCFYPIPCITKPLCSQAWEGHALQPGHAGLLTIQRGWCRVIPAASSPRAASKICYLTCSFGTRAELLFGIEIRSSKGRCLGGETFISQLRF